MRLVINLCTDRVLVCRCIAHNGCFNGVSLIIFPPVTGTTMAASFLTWALCLLQSINVTVKMAA